MIELAATHFAAQHPREIVFANRTEARAERLARRFSARTMRLVELPDNLQHFEVVVSCTASSLPLIGLGMVERVSANRAGRPIFMMDLAVPRDIEPEVARLPNVHLYTIDDLSGLVQAGASSRFAAVAQAAAIIETRVDAFMHWMTGRHTGPLLRALDERAERVRVAELAHAHRLLARGKPVETVLATLAHRLSNKFLHTQRSLVARGRLAPDEARQLIDQWPGQAGPVGNTMKTLQLQTQAAGAMQAA